MSIIADGKEQMAARSIHFEQIVAKSILVALHSLGGSASKESIKQELISNEGIDIDYETVYSVKVSNKTGNEYRPFDFTFNFALKNLFLAAYIEEYRRGSDIVLTEKGRSTDPGSYPLPEDKEKQKAYWDKKKEERQKKKLESENTNEEQLLADEFGKELAVSCDDADSWKIKVLEQIKQFTPKKFESFSRLLFSKIGVKFDPERGVKMSGDHGIDGYGYFVSDEFRTSKVVVQCKRYSENAVGEPAINEFMGVMMAENADYGIFITTSYFTKQAQKKAVQGSYTVTLIDGQKLVELIERYQLHIKPVSSFELDDYYYEQD